MRWACVRWVDGVVNSECLVQLDEIAFTITITISIIIIIGELRYLRDEFQHALLLSCLSARLSSLLSHRFHVEVKVGLELLLAFNLPYIIYTRTIFIHAASALWHLHFFFFFQGIHRVGNYFYFYNFNRNTLLREAMEYCMGWGADQLIIHTYEGKRVFLFPFSCEIKSSSHERGAQRC